MFLLNFISTRQKYSENIDDDNTINTNSHNHVSNNDATINNTNNISSNNEAVNNDSGNDIAIIKMEMRVNRKKYETENTGKEEKKKKK